MFSICRPENQHIVDTVNDILIELSDENWDDSVDRFKYRVTETSNQKGQNGLSIDIHRETGFTRKDVYPTIDRITNYLKSEGYIRYGMDIFDGYNCNVFYRAI